MFLWNILRTFLGGPSAKLFPRRLEASRIGPEFECTNESMSPSASDLPAMPAALADPKQRAKLIHVYTNPMVSNEREKQKHKNNKTH